MGEPIAARNQYPCGDDFYASARLNYQHSLLKQQTGFLLHPDVPLNKADLKVADIGAGTWYAPRPKNEGRSFDLPPSTQLDGFDLSGSQYPSKHWLPTNMTLRVHDAFTRFPEAFRGKYDVVHVAFFITLIRNNDPAPLIKNLMTLLKPGGYLQWNEMDASSGRIVGPENPAISADATMRFVQFLQNPQGGHSINWVPNLHQNFAQQGLVNTKLDRYEITPKYYAFWNLSRLWAANEINHKLYNDTARGKEIAETIAHTYAEFQQGMAVTADVVVAIGQKPAAESRN